MRNPWWRALGVFGPIFAGLCAIGLALIYYLGAGNLAFPDAMYSALLVVRVPDGLRDLSAFGYDGNMQWARLLGTIAFFAAAVGALIALLRDTLGRLRARLGQQPIAIIGGHPIASAALDFARASASGSILHLGAIRARLGWHVTTLPWEDIEHKAKIAALHVHGAKQILVADEDDAQTLTIARAAHRAASKARVTALVRDLSIATGASALAIDGRLRILSYGALAARALHLEHPPFMLAQAQNAPRIHALIVGFGDMGEAVLRDLVINCRTTKLSVPKITIVDPLAVQRLQALKLSAPEIEKTCEIDARSCAFSRCMDNVGATSEEAFTCIYVCVDTDTAALIALAGVQAWLRLHDQAVCPIFVRLRDKSSIDLTDASAIAFGDLSDLAHSSEFLSTTPDVAARAYHQAYCDNLTEAKRKDPSNKAARPWDQLAETYKNANRAAVAHIPAKLASAGLPLGNITPGSLPRLKDGETLYVDEAGLIAQAELEHERWNAERRLAGWRYAKIAQKDEARLLHPSLQDFEDLDEEVKGYDVAFVEATGKLLGVKSQDGNAETAN